MGQQHSISEDRADDRFTTAKLAAGAGVAIGAAFVFAGTAQAADFTVTNLDPDSDGTCDADCSLREAIEDANENDNSATTTDRVLFQAGLSGTINLNPDPNFYGQLFIDEALEIVGPGADTLTVSADADSRVFYVSTADGEDVTISGLKIIQGSAKYSAGGDIRNNGSDLTIRRSQIRTGQAEVGGGIASDGNLTVVDSTVTGNVATLFGGGATVGYGGGDHQARITGSSFVDNAAGAKYQGNNRESSPRIIGGGGALLPADSIVENSTFTGNATTGNGGAILNVSFEDETTAMAIRSTTISGNAAGAGGGVYRDVYEPQPPPNGPSSVRQTPPPNATIENTIVAGNEADGPSFGHDLGGGPFNTAFTLIQRPQGATFTETVAGSNILGLDPELGALRDNGGPTRTMALLDASPALDNGRTPAGETTDQRGQSRPVDLPTYPNNDATGGDGADIGAFERQRPVPEGTCQGEAATIGLEPAGEITFGTTGRDVIVGNGAANEIRGRGGNDLICGRGGRDVLRGGPGNDEVLGEAGADNVFGDQGNDNLNGGGGNDKVSGATGDDRMFGEGGQDRLAGAAGDDRGDGGAANDVLIGADGADALFGRAGNDRLNGGRGLDTLVGGPGRDQEIQQ